MKSLLVAVATGLALCTSVGAVAAPYEDYKVQIQRQHEAKRRALTAETVQVREDRAAMQEQLGLMRDMNAQMQQAQSLNQMTTEQMREWIARHAQLMDRMRQQMMKEHHGMSGSEGMKDEMPK